MKRLKKISLKQKVILLAVVALAVAAGLLASTFTRNELAFSQREFRDNAGIPKSVQTKVNDQGKLEILVSAGTIINGISRQIAVTEDSVKLNKRDNKITLTVNVYSGDVATTHTQNPRVVAILQDSLPEGQYSVEVLLINRTANPVVGDGIHRQETLTTTFRILE